MGASVVSLACTEDKRGMLEYVGCDGIWGAMCVKGFFWGGLE